MFLVYHSKALAEGEASTLPSNGAGSGVAAAEHHPFLDPGMSINCCMV